MRVDFVLWTILRTFQKTVLKNRIGMSEQIVMDIASFKTQKYILSLF